MGSKFKPGDKVKYIGRLAECNNPPDPTKVYTVKTNPGIFDGVFLKEHNEHFWYGAELFTLVEPDQREVPGVPEGYRLVRIGTPKAGETYLNSRNKACKADHDFVAGGYPVVEKTTKTERLWVWVDKDTGEATDNWFTEETGHFVSCHVSEVRTNKTREVPA